MQRCNLIKSCIEEQNCTAYTISLYRVKSAKSDSDFAALQSSA
ncbi:hypothetical protein predicted by Glimmer/Critica [Ruminococcus bicirculans (ex Wegman et al. 2014)]|uniref:Uncharacterized protein n=1 Tax=Ruminococcus bicirculans (ex Wegman et al. 2014) TaxID=1160721 RepID=A0ABM9QI61_9FIRM|nr:hypothetical protein predicted by Glimmer/Critica [Ruminococcus bicirculans (ex Wegman et al. 2014)]